MRPTLTVLAGFGLLLALDAVVIAVAGLVDPGAPIIYVSNLVATFIGAIQLLYGVPLALILRRRGRRELAAGIGVGIGLVLLLNLVALYR